MIDVKLKSLAELKNYKYISFFMLNDEERSKYILENAKWKLEDKRGGIFNLKNNTVTIYLPNPFNNSNEIIARVLNSTEGLIDKESVAIVLKINEDAKWKYDESVIFCCEVIYNSDQLERLHRIKLEKERKLERLKREAYKKLRIENEKKAIREYGDTTYYLPYLCLYEKEESFGCLLDFENYKTYRYEMKLYYLHQYIKFADRSPRYMEERLADIISQGIVNYKHLENKYSLELFTKEFLMATISIAEKYPNCDKFYLVGVPRSNTKSGNAIFASLELIEEKIKELKAQERLNVKAQFEVSNCINRITDVTPFNKGETNREWKFLERYNSLECTKEFSGEDNYKIILYDDIYTSGTTMASTAACLIDKGARKEDILHLVLAKAGSYSTWYDKQTVLTKCWGIKKKILFSKFKEKYIDS